MTGFGFLQQEYIFIITMKKGQNISILPLAIITYFFNYLVYFSLSKAVPLPVMA